MCHARRGKILRAPNIANIEQYIGRVDEMIERKRIVFAEKAKSWIEHRREEEGADHGNQR